jgi:phosphatidate cytidylyltransferase
MAFNLQTFKTRTLTAIVFAGVMLAGLFWNHWSFLALFTIIHFGCWWEYCKLLKLITGKNNSIYLLLGILYITMPVLMMIDMGIVRDGTAGNKNFLYAKLIPCTIIFSIWINDTMAYIVGSLMGRTPLSKISPKKTWEGTLGGILLAILIAGIIASVFKLGLKDTIIIAALSSIFGTLGDLLESKIKRMAGVKDSGYFMPGHGGFLDRFDSLLVAIPAVWLYVFFFLNR